MYSQLRFGYTECYRVSSTPGREVGFSMYSQLRFEYIECYRVSSTPEREVGFTMYSLLIFGYTDYTNWFCRVSSTPDRLV